MPGEKTEKASTKKRDDERKKGHIYQSQDIICAISLLSTFGVMKIMGASFEGVLASGMEKILRALPNKIEGARDMQNVAGSGLIMCAEVLLPIFAVSVLSAVVVTLAQTRLLVTPSLIAPKFDKINPVEGFKKLISVKSLVEMLKSLLKIGIILLIIYEDVYPDLSQIKGLCDTSLEKSLQWIGETIVDVGFKAGAVLLVIGVGDYFFQWWDFERNIMMTKQEVKDEFKETEGNPQVKNRIRQLRRRLSRMRMMQAVPKASVVIRNPTHFAVAIRYDEKKGKAPFVVAKGRDELALRIVDIAQKNHVFITENVPLAQALYKTVEIGTEIPPEFYQAVAEVLAYIYKMKRSGRTA